MKTQEDIVEFSRMQYKAHPKHSAHPYWVEYYDRICALYADIGEYLKFVNDCTVNRDYTIPYTTIARFAKEIEVLSLLIVDIHKMRSPGDSIQTVDGLKARIFDLEEETCALNQELDKVLPLQRSWLIDLRKAKGYSQETLAKELGFTLDYYKAIESGEPRRGTVSEKHAKKIADVLGFDWKIFFE